MEGITKITVKEREEIERFMETKGYRCYGLIGEGAFARVYEAQSKVTGKRAACKISPHKEMLKKEWELLSQLSHPVIPKVYEWNEGQENGYLFMEYIPGINLEQRIRQKGKLPFKQTITLAKDLAEGLCYLHEYNPPVIFRDLKPENIILMDNGRAKLLDFGSAVRLQDAGSVVTGSRGYAAPEQWHPRGRVGSHSDVYALGKVLGFAGKPALARRWFGRLLKDCTQERVEERIPNMRIFLVILERKRRGDRKKQGKLLYQQSVLKP